MKIHKILNNNVVIVLDEQKNEKIVCGKGIAFKKSAGDWIDERMINKVFVLSKTTLDSHLQEILEEIPLEQLEVTNDIIEMARKQFDKVLDENLFVSLGDHICTAIQRLSEGICIPNGLLWEIKHFYEKEYEIGLKALDIIEEKLKVRLPEDEAGFIAMHVVNAEMDGSTIQQVQLIMKIVQEIVNLVKYFFMKEFDQNSLYYFRFITHLKFFAQRMIFHKQITNEPNSELFQIVKSKYTLSYQCVEKIREYIREKYQYTLSEEEELYLTIHIEQVMYKSEKNKGEGDELPKK